MILNFHLKKAVRFLPAAFLLFSCQFDAVQTVEVVHKASSSAPPLNRPIPLEAAETVLVLRDYLPLEAAVDSIFDQDHRELTFWMDSLLGEMTRITTQPDQAIGFVQIWHQGQHIEIPTFRSESEEVTWHLSAEAGDRVFVMGDFNGWSRTATQMTENQPGEFEWTESMPKGKHPYQFVVNGLEMPDPSHSNRVDNGFGGFNSILTVGDPEAVPIPLESQWEAGRNGTNQIWLQTLPNALIWAYWDDKCYGKMHADSAGQIAFGVPATAYNLERSDLRFWAVQEGRKSDVVRLPLVYGDLVKRPDQLHRQEPRKMVMYFLMVDRFINGDPGNDRPVDDPGIMPQANHYGGDLAGILTAQDDGYFDDLGINTVWISPITQNPEDAWGFWQDDQTEITSKFSGYHGYWPILSTGVDDRFGTIEELEQLAQVLHSDHKNLLLDYVANHVHQEHPVYQKHPDWVTELHLPDGRLNTQLWDEQRLTTWFDTFMPSLDFSRPEVVETMTDSAVWWIENTGIDGFRHDATKHIPLPFWRTLTRKIRRQITDGPPRSVFQIGETYGAPDLINSYINRGMLDAQFDFNLYDAALNAFAKDTTTFDHLIDVIQTSLATYGGDHLMGNITGNQDRARFASLAEGTVRFDEDHKFAGWTRDIQRQGQLGHLRMRQLQAFILSMPGIPCLYYGDEIADVGGNDPDNRRMLRRSDLDVPELATRDHFSSWAHMRASRMSMIYGTTEAESPVPGVLSIVRRYPGETTQVLINKTPATQELMVKGSSEILLGKDVELATSESGIRRLVLPPHGCVALEPGH